MPGASSGGVKNSLVNSCQQQTEVRGSISISAYLLLCEIIRLNNDVSNSQRDHQLDLQSSISSCASTTQGFKPRLIDRLDATCKQHTAINILSNIITQEYN